MPVLIGTLTEAEASELRIKSVAASDVWRSCSLFLLLHQQQEASAGQRSRGLEQTPASF